MTDPDEKFCLKWNDFSRNIIGSFNDLRDEENLFDCTLSCGDKQIQAHKLILSACSGYFKNIFKLNPHNHPLLYLRGIKFDDLQSILTFMYQGEVNVAQKDLSNFLLIAEDLKVKGLTQGKKSSSEPVKKPSQAPPVKTDQLRSLLLPAPPPLTQVARKPSDKNIAEASDDHDVLELTDEVKTEPGPNTITHYHDDEGVDPTAEYEEEGMMEYGDYTGNGSFSGQMIGHEDPGFKDASDYLEHFNDALDEKYRCKICKKEFKDKSNCRRHIKNIHFNDEPVSCPICGRQYKNRNSFASHKDKCVQLPDSDVNSEFTYE